MKAGTAQSFLESSLPRAPLNDEAVVDDKDAKNAAGAGPCSCCCRCGRSRAWKKYGAQSTRRSQSHNSLRTGVAEITSWDWEPPQREVSSGIETTKLCGPGEAPLERLPVEILGMTIPLLTTSQSILIDGSARSRHCTARSRSSSDQLLPSERRSHFLSAYFADFTRSNPYDPVSSYHNPSFDHIFQVSRPSLRNPGFGYHC